MSVTAGTIQSVSQTSLGSTLAAAASGGDTSIFVTDTSDFDSIAGGTLQLGTHRYDYDTVDDDTGEITLLSTLSAGGAADDRVDAWDTVLGQVAVETRALVALPGTVDNDDSIDAIVAQSLAPLLELGLRDPGAGESVSMQQQGTDWLITDVRGRKPVVQPDASGSVPVGTEGFTVVPVSSGGETYRVYSSTDNSPAIFVSQVDGDAHPRQFVFADPESGMWWGDGTYDPLGPNGMGWFLWAVGPNPIIRYTGGLKLNGDLLFGGSVGDPTRSSSTPTAVGVRGYDTATRNSLPNPSGSDHYMVFDEDLGKPIWTNGSGGWVDATGTAV